MSDHQVYFGGFEDWDDVACQFCGVWDSSDEREIIKARTTIPEPDQVIVAEYERNSYDGSAYVCYRIGTRFYEVEGSHCSCYGLEDQWFPDESSGEALIASLERLEKDRLWTSLRIVHKDRVIAAVRDYLNQLPLPL